MCSEIIKNIVRQFWESNCKKSEINENMIPKREEIRQPQEDKEVREFNFRSLVMVRCLCNMPIAPIRRFSSTRGKRWTIKVGEIMDGIDRFRNAFIMCSSCEALLGYIKNRYPIDVATVNRSMIKLTHNSEGMPEADESYWLDEDENY